MTGGGGAMTGEMGFKGRLMFSYGNSIRNETGGYIFFRFENGSCRILYPGFHFSDFEADKKIRLKMYVRALMTAFMSCYVSDSSDTEFSTSSTAMGRTEVTSVSVYDVFNDKLDTLKIIQTKNLDSDLNEIISILRKNRGYLLELVSTYPAYFNIVGVK